MKNKNEIEAINKVINSISEKKCISFLWWLEKNPQAFEDFKTHKVAAMDIFIQFEVVKKYKRPKELV